ncbi:CD48 antigen-like [Sardina pilchardus]|uniref:CD48 antigen-like n=1 Tax=Sardina pilchardus TaxID=27697 RepID=UPI002E13914C
MCLSVVLLILVNPLHTAGSPTSVFRQTGGSVTLEFHQRRGETDSIKWEYGKRYIMTYSPDKRRLKISFLEGRVQFNNETFSLEVKNLQKNDSGLYSGEIISTSEENIRMEYKLSVLDPVEAPVQSVVSNWSSSDSCNVMVTCRGRDLSLTSTCNSSICSPEGGASDDSTLTISVREGVVICNYSNPVSWKHATLEIKPLCPINSETPFVSMIVISLVIVMIAGTAVAAGAAKHVYGQRSRDGATRTAAGPTQTEYAEVTLSSSPGSPDPAASIYTTVLDREPTAAEESPYDEICLQTLDVDKSSRNPPKNPSSNGERLICQNLQTNDSGLYRGRVSAGQTETKVEHARSILASSTCCMEDPHQPDSSLYATVKRT